MTAAAPSRLFPRLRFPEFDEKPAWSAGPLSNVVRSISSGLSLTQTNGSNGFRVTRIETIADGTVDINRVGRVTTDQDISSYRLSIGDILVSNINSISHIGKSVLIDRYYDLYHGMNLLRIEALSAVIYSRFLHYWLNTEIVRASIRSRANKAVNQASINQTELGNTIVLLPPRAEQRKIADCLGSLDDLIAAEGRKLGALRQHKQGLMQQLFPQPGETVPRLRFPEFRDEPRWDFLTLSSASDVNPSNDGLPELFIYIDLESVKSSMLIERKEVTRDAAPSRAQRLLSRKDIIYQTVRPYQRNNFLFNISDGYNYVASTGYAQIRAHDCPEFLYQLLHTDSFVNSILARCTGSNYPAINPSVLASIRVALPRKREQQKIADCLGSLDDLIAAERRKLESLRQHKQGLMQQLFPSLEAKSR